MGIIDDLTGAVGRGINLMMDREIRLGVTGLSRGGKTAFITSLVNILSTFGEVGTADCEGLADRSAFLGAEAKS